MFAQWSPLAFANISSVLNQLIIFNNINTGNGVFVLLFPLIISLSYSYVYAIEKKSGFLKYIKTKVNIKSYLKSKYMVNAICSGLIASSFIVLNLLINLLEYPVMPVNKVFLHETMMSFNLFCDLYYQSPFTYIILWIFIYFLIGAFTGSFGMMLSAFTSNYFAVFFIPFITTFIVSNVLSAVNCTFPKTIYFILNRILENRDPNLSIIIFTTIIGCFTMFFIFYNREKYRDEL